MDITKMIRVAQITKKMVDNITEEEAEFIYDSIFGGQDGVITLGEGIEYIQTTREAIETKLGIPDEEGLL